MPDLVLCRGFRMPAQEVQDYFAGFIRGIIEVFVPGILNYRHPPLNTFPFYFGQIIFHYFRGENFSFTACIRNKVGRNFPVHFSAKQLSSVIVCGHKSTP